MLCQSLNSFVFCAFWFMYGPEVNMSVSITLVLFLRQGLSLNLELATS